jgi:hypothetical protein
MARFEKREGRRRTGRSRLRHCRATEDPNPAAKRKEHKRLLTEGEKGIQVSLDPEFVPIRRLLLSLNLS